MKILLSRYNLIWMAWINRSSQKKYHLIIMYNSNCKMEPQRAKMITVLAPGVKISLHNSSWHRITFERASRSLSLLIRGWQPIMGGLAFNHFKNKHQCHSLTSKRSSLIYQVRLEIISSNLVFRMYLWYCERGCKIRSWMENHKKWKLQFRVGRLLCWLRHWLRTPCADETLPED